MLLAARVGRRGERSRAREAPDSAPPAVARDLFALYPSAPPAAGSVRPARAASHLDAVLVHVVQLLLLLADERAQRAARVELRPGHRRPRQGAHRGRPHRPGASATGRQRRLRRPLRAPHRPRSGGTPNTWRGPGRAAAPVTAEQCEHMARRPIPSPTRTAHRRRAGCRHLRLNWPYLCVATGGHELRARTVHDLKLWALKLFGERSAVDGQRDKGPSAGAYGRAGRAQDAREIARTSMQRASRSQSRTRAEDAREIDTFTL